MCLVAQSFPTLYDPMDCSQTASSVHGILQARILEWVAMPSSRGSSQLRDRTPVSYVSCIRQGSLPWVPPGSQASEKVVCLRSLWFLPAGPLEDFLSLFFLISQGSLTHLNPSIWELSSPNHYFTFSYVLSSSPRDHFFLVFLSSSFPYGLWGWVFPDCHHSYFLPFLPSIMSSVFQTLTAANIW